MMNYEKGDLGRGGARGVAEMALSIFHLHNS